MLHLIELDEAAFDEGRAGQIRITPRPLTEEVVLEMHRDDGDSMRCVMTLQETVDVILRLVGQRGPSALPGGAGLMRWNEDTVTGALAGMACLLAAFLVGYGAAHLFTLLLAL